MSRGLSTQQRAILGLGVRINRAVNGGEVVPIPGEPVQPPGWDVPVLYSPGLAEVSARYVLHLLHDVPIKEGPYLSSDSHLEHTPYTLSLKASVTRAISSLLKRGHIVLRPG